MTDKPMQKRNERAQQLRVIQVEEGGYFVESGDGKVAYKCLLNDEKEICTCLDYQRNAPTDPNFRCKHLLAILNCAPEGGEKKAFLKKRQPKLDERFIKNIEGKDFVLVCGSPGSGSSKRNDHQWKLKSSNFPPKRTVMMAIVKALL